MAEEPEVKPGETVVDPPKVAEEPGETVTGKEADAQAKAAEEREAFLTEIVSRTVVQTVAQLRAASPPTTTPPTTTAGPVADLEAEAQAIMADMKALEEDVRRLGGHSADTLLKRMELTDRTSALRAEATMRAVRMGEETQRVDALGQEDRWKAYFKEHRTEGTPAILRLAFEREEMKLEKKPAPATPKLTDRAPVDVSGASEVTATDRKARSMTREQVQAQKTRFEEVGDFKSIRDLDSKLRNGEVILAKS